MEKYEQDDVDDLRKVLVGRRIVDAEIISPSDAPDEVRNELYMHEDVGRLTLNNGMQLFIEGNVGCGGCTSGWYYVTKVAGTNNAITGVRIEEKEDKYGEPVAYRLFVITEHEELSALEVEGSMGNGYYGFGFDVYVLPMTIDGSVVDESTKAIEWKSVE